MEGAHRIMKELEINRNEAGQRFDKFLKKYLKEAPDSFIYKMLRKKNIVLNQKKANGKELLAVGDQVKFFLSDETIDKFAGAAMERLRPADALALKDKGKLLQPEVIYEDSQVIFFNKPSGVLSQKAKPEDVTMAEYVVSYLIGSGQMKGEELLTFRPSVCNRLDRNTSGIVSAGKTMAGLQFLSAAFRERALEKYYYCIVRGDFSRPVRLDGYLKKDGALNQSAVLPPQEAERAEREGYERIATAFRPLQQRSDFTLLEAELITGRPHQIRAHLAAQGHPIAGDAKYGDRTVNDRLRKACGLKYQLLHAGRLVFRAQSGRFSYLSGMEIRAEVPELFRRVCAELGFSANIMENEFEK